MSPVFFSRQTSEEFDGAIILISGNPLAIDASHENFEYVMDLLMSGAETSEEEIRDLVRPFEHAASEMVRLSERVTAGGNVLYFDGDPIDGALSSHILRILKEDSATVEGGFKNFVAFLEKLMQNPSEVSRQHLYDFVTHHNITITPEGDLALYKSTNLDGTATRSGYGLVTTPDGKITTYENNNLPNDVGYVVEIPRSMVNEDRNSACSTGLHVGAFSYAVSYSRKLWNVIVNPRDVVAVPHDASSAKIRVSRYEVVSVNEDKQEYTGHSYFYYSTPEFDYEDEFEDDDDLDDLNWSEDDEAAEPRKVQAPAPDPKTRSRVPEYEDLIKGLLKNDPDTNLRKFRGKKVTSGRRDEFTKAASNLGIQL